MAKKKTKTHARTRALARRPAPRARAKAPVRSTALVPSRPDVGTVVAPTPGRDDVGLVLRDEAYLATFGTDTLVLTDAQETVLAEPINADLVEVLPTGSVYLPHTEYAKWLDRAFGRTGWVLRPMANPRRVEEGKGDRTRVFLQQPFMLFVGGKAIAWAYGGAEYHEDNRDQNYDDVIESLQSFAIRRVCKHLRIGLELWDRRWVRAWLDRYAIKVSVDGSKRPQWRRSADPKLYKERGPWVDQGGASSAPSDGGAAQRSYGRSTSTEPISEPQLKRLIVIAKNHQVTDVALKDWLEHAYPYTAGPDRRVSKGRIRRCDYDAVVEAVERGLRPVAPVTPETIDATAISANDIDWDGPSHDDDPNRW